MGVFGEKDSVLKRARAIILESSKYREYLVSYPKILSHRANLPNMQSAKNLGKVMFPF